MFIKVSSAMCEAVGAKTEEEFSAKFESWLVAQNTSTQTISNAASKTEVAAVKLTADKAEQEAAKANDLVAKIKPDEILAEAKKQANLTATTVLGQVGQTDAVKVAPAPDKETPAHEKLLADGKLEEAWAVAPDKNDFPNAKTYAAFMRNQGSVKITTKG